MSERKQNNFKLDEYDDELFKQVISMNSEIQQKYDEFNVSMSVLKQQFDDEDNEDVFNDPGVIDHINSVNADVKQFNNLVGLIIEMQKKLAKEMKRGEDLKKEIENFNNIKDGMDDGQKCELLKQVIDKFDVQVDDEDDDDDDDAEMEKNEDVKENDLNTEIEKLVNMDNNILKVLGLQAIECSDTESE